MFNSGNDNDQSQTPEPDNTPTPEESEKKTTPVSETGVGVADPADNEKLEHTEGGTTTRDDATDVGVPMKPGSPNEPVGPEDALGDGPKRGDYTNRLGGSNPHTTERIPDAKAGERHTRTVAQAPKAENIGDEEGKKGGVTTGK